MVMTPFQDLAVFRKAYETSLEIHRHSLTFPKIEQFALGDQIRRASKSICANIAEGFGKQSHSTAEFRRYLTMAIGSADEMQVWCCYCHDLGYVDEATAQRWQATYAEIARMLNGLSRKARD